MIHNCPKHGQQASILISPDLLRDEPVVDRESPNIIFMMHRNAVEFAVLVSDRFAECHAIDTAVVSLDETIEWVFELSSICAQCCVGRWPFIRDRFRLTGSG